MNSFSTLVLKGLKENIPSAIDKMAPEFSTHQLILELAHKNQRAYVDALNEVASDIPFKEVHSAIGKELKQLAIQPDARIREKEAKTKSTDIFGHESSCSIWEKLA